MNSEEGEFFEWLDICLGDDRYAGDVVATHKLAVRLCEAIKNELSPECAKALDVANWHWSLNCDNERHAEQMEIFSRKIGSGESPIDRLIWCALNANTGLSAYAAEYISDISFKCGLTVGDLRGIFSDLFPDAFASIP
jgi:hypothetical protein